MTGLLFFFNFASDLRSIKQIALLVEVENSTFHLPTLLIPPQSFV